MPTVDDFIRGAINAERAGDRGAAGRLREHARAAQEAQDKVSYAPEAPTGLNAVATNIGAGMHRAAQGVGQMIGASTSQDVAEHNRYRDQLAQSTPAGGALQFLGEAIPSVAVPGFGATATAMRVLPRATGALTRGAAGAAVGGAVGGGVGGLLGATEREDIGQAKAEQALAGAGMGAALGPAVGVALPQAARLAGRYLAPTRRAQDIFTEAATEGGARRPGQVAQTISNREQSLMIPGENSSFIPTAGLAGSRQLMGLNELVRNTGGTYADPLRALGATGAGARARLLERNVEQPGNLARARGREAQLYGDVLGGGDPARSPLFRGYNPDDTADAIRQEIQRASGPVRQELAVLLDRWDQAVEVSARIGSWKPLYDFRKVGLDDRIAALGHNTNLAKEIRSIFNNKIRPVVDVNLQDASLDPTSMMSASNRLVGPGSEASRTLSRIAQLEEGKELAGAMRTQTGIASTGDPLTTSPALTRRLKDLKENPLTDYGEPRLGRRQEGSARLLESQADALRALEAPDLRMQGSATAHRLTNMPAVLKRANDPKYGMNLTTAGIAASVMHPTSLMGLLAANIGLNWSAKRTAAELGKLLADPAHAQAVLRQMEARMTKTAENQQALAGLKDYIGRAARGGFQASLSDE